MLVFIILIAFIPAAIILVATLNVVANLIPAVFLFFANNHFYFHFIVLIVSTLLNSTFWSLV